MPPSINSERYKFDGYTRGAAPATIIIIDPQQRCLNLPVDIDNFFC